MKKASRLAFMLGRPLSPLYSALMRKRASWFRSGVMVSASLPVPVISIGNITLGGTGKTGRRVVERLKARGVPVRIGSRSAELPFEWQDQTTWAPVLQNVAAVYITYYPDLAVPGAADTIRAFVDQAVQSGVRRLVLLSGRGEEEAQRCERIVQDAGAEWTILRSSWFSQNFSEAFMRDLVLGGMVALPAGDLHIILSMEMESV